MFCLFGRCEDYIVHEETGSLRFKGVSRGKFSKKVIISFMCWVNTELGS